MEVKELQPYWGKHVKVISSSGNVYTGMFDGYTPDEYDEDTDTEKPSIDLTLDSTEYVRDMLMCIFVENIVSIEIV